MDKKIEVIDKKIEEAEKDSGDLEIRDLYL